MTPDKIKEKYKKIQLCIDAMHANGMPFPHSVSEGVELRSCTYLDSESKEMLKKAILEAKDMHSNNGFEVVDIGADGQFECLKYEIEGVKVDAVDPVEHNNKVERSARTAKDGIRCQAQGLPYRRITKQMLRKLVELVHRNLNIFSTDDAIIKNVSPL